MDLGGPRRRADGSHARPLAVLRRPAGRRVRRPGPHRGGAEKGTEDAIKKITAIFDDARAYAKAKNAAGTPGRPFDPDPALEAMLPVLDGTLPVVIHATEIKQIRSAIAWADGQGVRIIVARGG
jgi:imidazolonepropionase-like amidohydrolase